MHLPPNKIAKSRPWTQHLCSLLFSFLNLCSSIPYWHVSLHDPTSNFVIGVPIWWMESNNLNLISPISQITSFKLLTISVTILSSVCWLFDLKEHKSDSLFMKMDVYKLSGGLLRLLSLWFHIDLIMYSEGSVWHVNGRIMSINLLLYSDDPVT